MFKCKNQLGGIYKVETELLFNPIFPKGQHKSVTKDVGNLNNV
uniref:Uncharacterized protein n=1 Tax=Rhizophora mucronata TaxID=61149 RepID=A0A2P2Q6P0_RHIMU